MTFLRLTPWQFTAVFAASAATVTVLYLLRVRPRRALVPFEPLWADVLEAERRTNPLRRIRRLISLLLQVLMAALLALALAEPRLAGRAGARHLVIVIDVSASMQAAGKGLGRFEQAMAFARRVVEDLRTGDHAMLVAADAGPHVVCTRTGSQRTLLRALAALRPSDTHGDLGAAMRLASAAVADDPDGRILLLTDVNAPPVGDSVGLSADRIEVHRFGTPGPNLAIVAFEARAGAADPLQSQVFVEIASFADQARSGILRLHAGDRQAPVQVVPVTVAPGARWRRVFREPISALGPGPLRADLEIDDDLAADNVAYAFLPPPPTLTVELVADTPDFFLLKAIETHPNVTVRHTLPSAYLGPEAGTVPIFQGWAPETPPSGSAIYIDPPVDRSPLPVARTLDRAPITELEPEHPVMRRVSLEMIEAGRTLAFRPRPGDVVLARSLDHPVIVAWEDAASRRLVIGFETAASDLPLRAAFPLLVANTLNWIRSGAALSDRRSFRVGEPVSLDVPAHARSATAVWVSASRPPGKLPVTVHDGRARLTPRSIGFYRVSGNGLRRTVAVNTVDMRECDLRAAMARRAPDRAAEDVSQRSRHKAPSLLVILLWSAVAVTGIEWLSYHRRWTV